VTVEKIKRLIKAGSTIPGAIKEVLSQNGLSVAAFAKKHERNPNNMNSVITGTRAPAAGDVEALIAELGGTDIEWRQLLHDAGRPTNVKAAV
jgi:hypothetical protein